MDWKKHCYRAGTHTDVCDDLPIDPAALEKFIANARARIEPWLSAIFQAEHLNLSYSEAASLMPSHHRPVRLQREWGGCS
jgi:hypothetical protein